MTVKYEVWLDEKTKVGEYKFMTPPRRGETISLPGKGESFAHYRVEDVTHRAEGIDLPSITFLFVSTPK